MTEKHNKRRFCLFFILLGIAVLLCGCSARQPKTASEDYDSHAVSEADMSDREYEDTEYDDGPVRVSDSDSLSIAEEEDDEDLSALRSISGLEEIAGQASAVPVTSDQEYGDTGYDRDRVRMTDVDSTVIAEAGYDEDRSVLLLRFRSNGALYAYYNVDEGVYRGLLRAASKGTYFGNNIKDVYRYEKLESGDGYKVTPLYDETSYASARYVVNNGSARFHTKSCRYAASGNTAYVSNSRSELEALGYHPCRLCLPD